MGGGEAMLPTNVDNEVEELSIDRLANNVTCVSSDATRIVNVAGSSNKQQISRHVMLS
jgi:hypothetical protein